MSKPNIKATIDARAVEPPLQQQTIFNTFNRLLPGDALLLIHDHDPDPLYRQFQTEFGELFTWAYEEQGPTVWQIRIGRISACCV